MLKQKKLSKILVSLIMILIASFSLVFVALQINKSNNETNNMTVATISDLNFIEPYGIIDGIGDGGSGTESDPYFDDAWNGRIKSQDCFTRLPDYTSCYVEINVDPRDRAVVGDDIIIEFKAFTQAPTLGIKKPLQIGIGADIIFYSNNFGIIEVSKSIANNKSSGGVTVPSGKYDIGKVFVNVCVSLNGVLYDYYYQFGGKIEI